MQSTVTPAPGRTPARWKANVIDTLNYKVDVVLTELRNENWQLEIKTWTPEHKWVVRELFLTMEELERFRKALK
jgi:hypothetical protein